MVTPSANDGVRGKGAGAPDAGGCDPAGGAPGASRPDVVVTVHNSLHFVRPCLDSLFSHTSHPFRLVIVNDGSDETTSAFLRSFVERLNEPYLLLENETSKGFVQSCNSAFDVSDAPYVILLNSDTVVTPRWLGKLVSCAESDERIGLVTPLSNNAANLSVAIPPGLNVFQMAQLVEDSSPRKYPDAVTAHGFCLLFTRKMLDELGGFDPVFGRGYAEETDYHMRATTRGYRSVLAGDTFVYHVGRGTFGTAQRSKLFARNREVFMSRWEEPYLEQLRRFNKNKTMERIRARLRPKTAVYWGATLRTAWQRGREHIGLHGLRGVLRRALRYFFVHEPARRPAAHATPGDGNRPGPTRVTYLLPHLEPSRAVLSVLQHVNEMVLLGAEPRIAVVGDPAQRGHSLQVLSEPMKYPTAQALVKDLPPTDVLVATHPAVASTVRAFAGAHPGVVTVCLPQDDEEWPDAQREQSRDSDAGTGPCFGHCVVPSDRLAQELVDQGCSTHTLPVGISPDVFYRRDVERPEQTRVLVMCRAAASRGGLDALMTVLERLRLERPGVELVLCGEQPPQPPGFEHTPVGHPADPQDLARLYSGVDVLLDLSQPHGLARTGLEAMACGTATVLADVGGVDEYARDGENCLLVPPGDPARTYEAVVRLIDDPNMRARLAEQGRATASRYGHRRAAREALDYFASLAEQG